MTTPIINDLSFRDFVELMQEASGDRARKISRIKADISSMENHIKNMEQSHDRYHTAGSAKEDHAKLNSLRAQLRRYEPNRGPSSKQRRVTAVKKQEDRIKSQAERKAKDAQEAKAKARSDEIHKKAKEAADKHVAAHHPDPPRKDGEDIFGYIGRTQDHSKAKSAAHYSKYLEVRKKLQDEHKDV